MILPGFDAEMANTKKMLEKVPDGDPNYKPAGKSMELMRLASHVAELPSWATMTMKTETLTLDESMKPTVAATQKELLELFDKHSGEARDAITKASDEDMLTNWSLYWNGQTIMSMPRYQVIVSSVLSHIVHHRAQLQVYLRIKGIPVPGMYGPSADEMEAFGKGA